MMAVVAPEACGLGGDLWAVIARTGEVPVALNASGRSGSGADPERLRAEGRREMPFQHDVRAVTVPGFVDGLIGLHARFATQELDELLAPAHRLAETGFPVSSSLADKSLALTADQREAMFGQRDGLRAGRRLRLPRLADVLSTVAGSGRAGFYTGSIGRALVELGAGEFSEDDMSAVNADWVEPIEIRAWRRPVWRRLIASTRFTSMRTVAACWRRSDFGHARPRSGSTQAKASPTSTKAAVPPASARSIATARASR